MFHLLLANDKQIYESVISNSTMIVTGTSSLHDWEMTVEDFNCDVTFVVGNPSIKLLDLSFSAQAKSIKSHNSIMDNKTYKAVNANKYPTIQFKSSDIEFELPLDNSLGFTVPGELTLAGKTKKINLPFKAKINSDNMVEVTGSKTLKMTDFGIDPPVAILGTLKTGNNVTVHFSLIMELQTNKYRSRNENDEEKNTNDS